jgi:hypothetical protein
MRLLAFLSFIQLIACDILRRNALRRLIGVTAFVPCGT